MALSDILEARGIEVQYGQGNEIRVCCPFCVDRGESPDERFRLGINQYTGSGHCFNCDWSSKDSAPKWVLIKLRMKGDMDELAVSQKEVEEEEVPPVVLPDGFQLLKEASDYWSRRARRYLLDRNVTPKQIRTKLIGFTMQGRYAYRIIFPVLNEGNLVGLVARAFTPSAKVRYLNSVGDKYLWNYTPAKRTDPKHLGRTIILSEGIFKALNIERLGHLTSASVLGHNITSNQLQQLEAGRYRTAILWPDPDKPGIDGVVHMAQVLQDKGFRVKTIVRFDKAGKLHIPTKQADELPDHRVVYYLESCVVPYSWKLEQQLILKSSEM
jgi:hypothetical protein